MILNPGNNVLGEVVDTQEVQWEITKNKNKKIGNHWERVKLIKVH